jgi:hypothetical protein
MFVYSIHRINLLFLESSSSRIACKRPIHSDPIFPSPRPSIDTFFSFPHHPQPTPSNRLLANKNQQRSCQATLKLRYHSMRPISISPYNTHTRYVHGYVL